MAKAAPKLSWLCSLFSLVFMSQFFFKVELRLVYALYCIGFKQRKAGENIGAALGGTVQSATAGRRRTRSERRSCACPHGGQAT